jgi:tetratricopeptide (TPR) repeat protein
MATDGDTVRTKVERALALRELGRWKEAAKVLASAVAEDPNDGEALVELAKTLDRLGRSQEALTLVDRALGNFRAAWAYRVRANILDNLERSKEAIESVREAIRIAPNVAVHHAALAKRLRMDRRPEEALAAARRAVELDPNQAFCWEQQGDAALDVGQHELAERSYREALRLEPENVSRHVTLANALRAAGRAREGAQLLQSALKLDPTDMWLLTSLAFSLERLGDLEPAKELRRSAEAVAGEEPSKWIDLGNAATDAGEMASARRWYGRAFELDPERAEAAQWYASLQDDPAVGLAIVEKGLSHNPDAEDLIKTQLELLARLGRHNEAIGVARRRFEKSGDVTLLTSAAALAGRLDEIVKAEPHLESLERGHERSEEEGSIALARGQWELAEKKFREVLTDGSSCCCSWAGLGLALERQGRRAEAQDCAKNVAKNNAFCLCVKRARLVSALAPPDQAAAGRSPTSAGSVAPSGEPPASS